MNTLFDDFTAAVVAGEQHRLIPHLKPHPRLSAAQRVRIYSDGYKIRLTEALAADFPAVISLVGMPLFEDIAGRYITQTPSTSYTLDAYGGDFAAFFGRHKDGFPAALAVLEAAIAAVFTMPDSAALTPSAFAAKASEGVETLTLPPRTAHRLLQLDYPVNSWLSAYRQGEAPALPAPQPEWLLVHRHQNTVRRVALSHPAFVLLEGLFKGLALSSAVEQAVSLRVEAEEEIAANVQQWLADWLEAGVFGGG